MKILRWFLLPITLLYTVIIWFRNRLYDYGILKSTSYNLPVIVIGNLAVGGTGKSPMTEYVLRLVKDKYRVAVLSRGYGRRTKGFYYVESTSDARDVGDEPLQIKRKFPDNTVAVSENRCIGVEKLKDKHDAILLDDAFQHRKLTPSFSILLFDYQSLQEPILSLPTGNFRDLLQESRRADVIVVTKSPEVIHSEERFAIETRFLKYTKAPVFFSRIAYQSIIDKNQQFFDTSLLQDTAVLLLTGIANPIPLYAYLKPRCLQMEHISFPDHHAFTDTDINRVVRTFNNILNSKKIILTTEKDMQRLPQSFVLAYPIYYIPITQEIAFNQSDVFNTLILRSFVTD
ncbi:tetraacyldisaccharide 4'-kinase [Sphingobacterium psychroaquaticum]|nr:tetraacyldisaccharide 4'-kinase [Sphingobacterium psychroaquaticum]